jgi:PAS domain S-box-containing protein
MDPTQLAHDSGPSEEGMLRASGIDVIGAVPWGTHFCQFYNTRQDLVETLVPYFKAGLDGNEFCMWVTSTPLLVKEATAAMQKAVPDLEVYLSRGQIEILDYSQWYIRQGRFDANVVLQGWSDKLSAARELGFEGMRLSGNTFWLEQANWDDFTLYEEAINNTIGGQRMIALCTYSLEKCGVREILDVVANHQFALIKTGGRLEIIESAKHEKMEHSLRESEERYRGLFTQMNEGFALHEIICDASGKAVDYRFLDVNPAFEQFTGLSKENVLGRTIMEILPETEPYWIEVYGDVALSGKPRHFQNYSQSLGKYYNVMAFCPRLGQFAALFIDITEQKRLQEQAREAAAHIELQRRLIEQREQERLQIAQELHDGPIQELTGASYALQALTDSLLDATLIEKVQSIRQSITAQITELRAFSQELRPPVLTQFGLEKAIRAHIETFQQKHSQLSIHFESLLDEKPIPGMIQLALYRIYQEALNNILKHAQASQVEIRLKIDEGQMFLSIQDNGVGFEPPEDWLGLVRQGHLGLVGIRERAEAVGGSIKINSAPNQGTNIFVTVPISG